MGPDNKTGSQNHKHNDKEMPRKPTNHKPNKAPTKHNKQRKKTHVRISRLTYLTASENSYTNETPLGTPLSNASFVSTVTLQPANTPVCVNLILGLASLAYVAPPMVHEMSSEVAYLATSNSFPSI